MRYIVSPDEMRKCDAEAINKYGIASIVLMENAARSTSDFIKQNLLIPKKPIKVAIFCGSGNNGGDGFALARHLFGHCGLTVYWIGEIDKMSPETLSNFTSDSKIGIKLVHLQSEEEIDKISSDFDIVIDSLIGVGGSENLHGLVLPLLKRINSIRSVKLAVDSPTGLNTLSGMAHQDCFVADYTVSMYAIKTGMLINQGPEVCGLVHIADLGAPDLIVKKYSHTFAFNSDDILTFMPKRSRSTSKFDYGKVALIAGSTQYPGAGALCANSAITAGAGFVYLLTSKVHPSLLPEVIPCTELNEDDHEFGSAFIENALKIILKCKSLAIGPGIGNAPNTIQTMRELINKISGTIPVIIDADGLKAIQADDKLDQNFILTPHIGEMAELIGESREFVKQDALNIAKAWAKKLNCIILLKDTPTIITDGETVYLNLNGNPGMATAGSGDVLTGIIASLCAQKKKPLEAAALGAFLHASAGDYFASNFSETCLTASELIKALKHVI